MDPTAHQYAAGLNAQIVAQEAHAVDSCVLLETKIRELFICAEESRKD